MNTLRALTIALLAAGSLTLSQAQGLRPEVGQATATGERTAQGRQGP